MVTYKHHIFLSIIDNISLNENYNSNSTSLLDLLLEAPIDDKTVSKMIADKKRVSIYYQGDIKSKKGWYSIEPIRIDKKNGSSYLLAYSIPKDGGKPELKYFSQPKIVNWNILGNKEVTLSKDYEKKLFKFFKDPKIPKEQKLSYSERLNKMGVDVKNLLKKSGKKAALITVGGATLLLPFKNNIQQYLRQQAPHVAQLVNTRDITQDDFRSNEVKMMGMLINNAIKDGQSPEKGVVTYKQYRSSIAKDVASGDMMSVKNIMNQLKQDPEVLVAMTLGQFSYQKNDDGSYTVTDKYDFSKWKTIDTKKDDVKDLSYPAAIAKIMKDNNVNIYPAIRHMAYLESPDDVPGTITKKAVVNVPAKYVTTYDLSATSDIPYD